MLLCSASRSHLSSLARIDVWLFTAVHRDCTASGAGVTRSDSTPLNIRVEFPFETRLHFHLFAQPNEYGLMVGR